MESTIAATGLLDDVFRGARGNPDEDVPSALVPGERNFVLNPRHPDFSSIRIGEPEDLYFDPLILSD